ncbi:hypothetical protein ACFTXO_18090 [Streptomyces sp. NPDC057067]|uniref:hypothetical protein n=1 Tax=unclassified Streptomyces TaxID=2593676 RepID=UPI0036320D8D
MSTIPAPATHDYGPSQRQRGVDYSITSFDRTPDGVRFHVAGHVRAGDTTIRQGDEVTITPPGYTRGCACRVAKVRYYGNQWDAVLDMPPPARQHEPGARPMPLSRMLHP